MKTIEQVTDELAAKSKAITEIFAEAGPDMDLMKVKSLEGDSQARVETIQGMNKELDDLHNERERLLVLNGTSKKALSIHEALNVGEQHIYTPGEIREGPKPTIKTLGQLFLESKAAEQKHTVKRVEIPEGLSMKTLFQTSAGWDPEAIRIDRVALYPLRPVAVVDHIPIMTTGMDTIKYMKETTFTNNAAEVAAGGTYGEAALVYTETSRVVEKIGVWLPCTDEQLEDVAGITDLLNQRLTYMLRNRLDGQVLIGDGSTPNLLGTLNISSLLSQALGADSRPDAFYKAITQVRATGFAEPTSIFIHPNDWQSIRLLTTADGIYIFGAPSDPGPERLWGVPVVVTTAQTENTSLLGDYRTHSALFMRRGIEFQVTNAHNDFFIKGKQAIRCDLRCAMVHFRDEAFCKVTGI